MKTIIAGSREIEDMSIVEQAIIDSGFEITEVVCGEARGVDLFGKEWADKNGIPVKSFPADWDEYGTLAGLVRNEDMAIYADALIAVWDGSSKGTANMVKAAKARHMKVYVCKT